MFPCSNKMATKTRVMMMNDDLFAKDLQIRPSTQSVHLPQSDTFTGLMRSLVFLLFPLCGTAFQRPSRVTAALTLHAQTKRPTSAERRFMEVDIRADLGSIEDTVRAHT